MQLSKYLFLGLVAVFPFTANGSQKNIRSSSYREEVRVVRKDSQTAPSKPVRYNKQTDVRFISSISEKELNKELKGVLAGKAKTFIQVQNAYGISATFLASVAKHESGNGSSKMARTRNNVFGLKGKKFKSVDDCIWYVGKLLVNSNIYFKKGNTTISKIQKKYAPLYCKSNKNWARDVINIANKLELVNV